MDRESPAPGLAGDFELEDQDGAAFRLRDRLAPGGMVLVFYRGHWCPYCRRYLGKLQANYARLLEMNARLAGISPEPPAAGRMLARQLGLAFPLLSDPDGATIDRYGVRNRFLAGQSLLPHPAVFVLDAEGRIAFQHIDRNFKKRTTIRAIFQALAALPSRRD